jgi:hypothetical protein
MNTSWISLNKSLPVALALLVHCFLASILCAEAPSVLFVGNSFTFALGSPAKAYGAKTVTDLNGKAVGGVPALFKAFADQAGRDYLVSLETVGGKGLDFHVKEKAKEIGRAWDIVVLQGYSTLDVAKPGDPGRLVSSVKEISDLLRSKNPKVDIRLMATWTRADLVYAAKAGRWKGKPVETMALDIRAGYDLAAAGTPGITCVMPVGEAWIRAMKTGVADANPYDGISPGQMDLWGEDHYHGSTYGYYLEALVVFGDLTGLDPRSLGKDERAAAALGVTPAQVVALQQVAYDELMAAKGHSALKSFAPVKPPR